MSDETETAPSSNGLIDRLFKRHVIQTVAIYVAVAWGAVEILITLTENLGGEIPHRVTEMRTNLR